MSLPGTTAVMTEMSLELPVHVTRMNYTVESGENLPLCFSFLNGLQGPWQLVVQGAAMADLEHNRR
jgi:hypothetical protein